MADVVAALGGDPSYEAVRTTLRVLESKGAVVHRVDDRRFVYSPTTAGSKAWRTTARRLADVFFGGSIERAALAMLKVSDADFSKEQLRELEEQVAAAEAAEKSRRKPKA